MDGVFVGRDPEIQRVQSAVAIGKTVVVEAEAGMGKTSLVLRTFQESDCTLISGGFLSDSSHPYQAFIKAFEAFCFFLLEKPEAEIEVWRQKARELIAGRYALVDNAFPQLIRFANALPDPFVWAGTPAEAQHVLQALLTTWWQSWDDEEGTFVLFLDDLHWADEASLELFVRWSRLSTPKRGLVGTVRPTREGGSSPPLPQATHWEWVTLRPLTWAQTEQLVVEALSGSPQANHDALVATAYATTGGHPLFLTQWLYHRTDTVGVETVLPYLEELFDRMPAETKKILGVAAFLEEGFTAQDLSSVTGAPLDSCLVTLRMAKERRFLTESQNQWRFLHDNLRLAAESLVTPGDRTELHLRLGQHYRDRSLLLAAHHLSLAWSGGGTIERRELIRLCRRAGLKAQQGGSLALAWRHLSFAVQLVEEEDWETLYRETLELVGEAARAAFWNHAPEERDSLASQLIRRARTEEDRCTGLEVQIQSLVADGRADEASDLCVQVLFRLGFPVVNSVEDLSPRQLRIGRRALFRWGRRGWKLPGDRTPQADAVGRLLVAGMAATFIARPRRFAPFAFSALGVLYSRRPDPLSAYLVLCFGSAEFGWLRNPIGGRKAVDLAWKIHEKTGAREFRGKFLLTYVNSVSHWMVGWDKSLGWIAEATRISKFQGDFEFTSLAAGNHSLLTIECRMPLEEAHQISQRNLKIVEDYGYSRGVQASRRALQYIHNLRTPGLGPIDQLRGPYLNEETQLSALRQAGDFSGIMLLWNIKIHLACVTMDYRGAWSQWASALEFEDGLRSQVYYLGYLKMVVLVGWSLWPDWTHQERGDYEPRLRGYLKVLKTMAQFRPNENRFFVEFLQLEEDRAKGRPREYDHRYRLLDSRLEATNQLLELGLLRERHALWLESQQRMVEAMDRWRSARQAFSEWGAFGVVDVLSQLRPSAREASPSPSLRPLMEAGRLISEEIDLSKLVQNVVRLLLTLTGADYGYLRYDGPESSVGAEGFHDGAEPVTRLTDLPRSVSLLRFRMASLGEGRGDVPLIINDLAPSSSSEAIRSLLWIPILHHGRSLGGVLLEHGSMPRLFTPERVQIAELLVSQAAVSLENATLHRVRENLAREREGMIRSERLSRLGSLTAQVAHEVNNPNHVIRLNAGVIENLAREVDDVAVAHQIVEAVHSVQEASARIHRITSELKTSLGRANANELVDLNLVIESAYRLSERHWAQYTGNLALDLAPRLPAVLGDFDKLRQVVLNLVENSCQALSTPTATVRILSRLEASDGSVVLEVEDEGPGIPEGLLPRVTEPFVTTRQASGGTGLGLHIVSTILREHRAQMTIHSIVGQGTRITVRFPAAS